LLHYALFAEDHGLEDASETSDVAGVGLKRPAAGGTSERGGRKRRAEAAVSAQATPLSEEELEEEVERALTLLFAGNRDDCSFEELYLRAASNTRVLASGRDGVNRALIAMEEKNKVMHREGRIHLI